MDIPGAENPEFQRFFENVAKTLEHYFDIKDARQVVESYYVDYAKGFSEEEDYDYVWFPLLHEAPEYWHAQALLGSRFIKSNYPQYWRDYKTLEEFDISDIPEDYEKFITDSK